MQSEDEAITALVKAVKDLDFETFRKIITAVETSPFYSLCIQHKLVGEMLVSLDEQMSIVNIKELGFLIVEQANRARLWHDALVDVEAHEAAEERAAKPKKRRKK